MRIVYRLLLVFGCCSLFSVCSRGIEPLPEAQEKVVGLRVGSSTIPEELYQKISEYLDLQSCFAFAQTSKQNLFAWSTYRKNNTHHQLQNSMLSSNAALGDVMPTAAMTTLLWSDRSKWPTKTHSVLRVVIDQDISDADLNLLQQITNLEDVRHLHLVAAEGVHPYVSMFPLLADVRYLDPMVGGRLDDLETLTLEDIYICNAVSGVAFKRLSVLFFKGRFVPPDKTDSKYACANIVLHVMHLKYASLKRVVFDGCGLTTYDISRIITFSLRGLRHTVEVKNNHARDFHGRSLRIPLFLSPCVSDDGSVVIDQYMKILDSDPSFFIADGTSVLRTIALMVGKAESVVSLADLFSLLSRKYFDSQQAGSFIGKVFIPVMRCLTNDDRLNCINKLIPGSQLKKRNDGTTVLSLPVLANMSSTSADLS